MKQYLDIVNKIIDYGQLKQNRTGIPSLTIFGAHFEHEMASGFPLLTTKKIPFQLVASELEFFLKGITDKRWLQERNNHIWDDWASPAILENKYSFESEKIETTLNTAYEEYLNSKYLMETPRIQKLLLEVSRNFKLKDECWKKKSGGPHKHKLKSDIYKFVQYVERDLGPIYGWQWRHFGAKYRGFNKNYTDKGTDQLKELISKLENDHLSRRMIISAWAPHQLHEMALHPCHYSFQIGVVKNSIDLQWNQRSVDTMLGLPFNIASYGLLLHLLAKQFGYLPGKLIGSLGDTHIYQNHLKGVKQQQSRKPRELPSIRSNNMDNIFDWTFNHSSIINYHPYERINFDIAV